MNVKYSCQHILKKDKYRFHVQMVDVFWILMNADLYMRAKEESSNVMMEVADEILIQIFVRKRLSLQNRLDFVLFQVNKSTLKLENVELVQHGEALMILLMDVY